MEFADYLAISRHVCFDLEARRTRGADFSLDIIHGMLNIYVHGRRFIPRCNFSHSPLRVQFDRDYRSRIVGKPSGKVILEIGGTVPNRNEALQQLTLVLDPGTIDGGASQSSIPIHEGAHV